MYKLWTSVIQRVMYEFAEANMLLSETQSGFRQRTGRHIPIQSLVMMLEDARLSGQDIYTIQVDLSKAFDTIDQDRLWQLLYDYAYGTDTIEVLKNLYQGASTCYQTPYGPTPPVPVDPGTMQGDTLSPLLFLLYIEPLIRWLNAGGRGYTFGCVPEADKVRTRCACLAYADDLQIATGKLGDLHAQTRKITEYLDWAQMRINGKKTFVSGILHGMSARFGGSAVNGSQLAKQLGDLYIQGERLQYLPPTQPLQYLGVTLTMNLNWKHNFSSAMAKAKGQAEALRSCLGTSGQVIKLAETVLRPGITSSFCAAPFTPMQLKLLDGVMVGAYKRAYKQRRSTPTAAVHEDAARFGMGCTSLLVEYTQEGVKQLTHAYNDKGAYGIVTRSLLAAQQRALGGLNASELGAAAMHHMRIRQLSAAEMGGLQLTNLEAKETLQFEGIDVRNILRTVRESSGEHLANVASQKVLVPLLQLGMEHITDVLNPDCTHVLSVTDLKLKFGGNRIKSKHVHALCKLAYLLHDPAPAAVCTDKARLTQAARR